MKLFVVCPECNLEDRLRKFEGPSILFATSLGADLDALEVRASIQYYFSNNKISKVGVAIRESCQIVRPYSDSPDINFRKNDAEHSNATSWCPESIIVQSVRSKILMLQEIVDTHDCTVVGGLIFNRDASSYHKVTPRLQ